MQYPQWIWHNGTIKPWADATTHVMSHALHYGSSVFEGERVYSTPQGPQYFRLAEHTERRPQGDHAQRQDGSHAPDGPCHRLPPCRAARLRP